MTTAVKEQEVKTLVKCVTCGNTFQGEFCNRCGEKVLVPQERSLKHFFTSLLSAFTFIDGRFLKTLKLTMTKPGFISREFSLGRRKIYLPILSLFLVVNLFYFLFPVFQTFDTKIRSHKLHFYGAYITRLIEKDQVNKNLTAQEYTAKFEQIQTGYAKTLLIVFVFLQAIPLSLLYFKRKYFFVDHLNVSLELWTFLVLVNTLLPYLIQFLKIYGIMTMSEQMAEELLGLFFVSLIFYFMFRAGRLFYEQKIFPAIWKPLIFIISTIYTLLFYRFFLFMVTYWTM
jgi:hypothetical protein